MVDRSCQKFFLQTQISIFFLRFHAIYFHMFSKVYSDRYVNILCYLVPLKNRDWSLNPFGYLAYYEYYV